MPKKKSRDDQYEKPLKIGTIPHFNARPLTRFLPERFPGCTIETLLPSQMQFRLISHHLDLALMPIIELMSIPSGFILGNPCIACLGASEDIILVSKKPIKKVRSVALDVTSRTGIALTDIVFRAFCRTKPERFKLPENADLENVPSDAFMVIGDKALACEPSDKWEYRYDLGEAWYDATGLPFVFAAWVACTDLGWLENGHVESLEKSRDDGITNINRIISENAKSLPIESVHRLQDFLVTGTHYNIGEGEIAAMETFFELALAHGIIKERQSLKILETKSRGPIPPE